MMVKKEVVDCEINNNTQKTATELIRFNGNRQPHYQGYCKLEINKISQFLLVEPINENFVDIVGFNAYFQWKFIKQKNILFVFGEFDTQDFALVFKDEKICRKVYIGIFKNRSKDFVTRKLFLQRFLNPIFKRIVKNDSSKLKEIFEEWIQKHDGIEKDQYLKRLKWHQKNPEMEINDEIDIKNVKMEMDPKPHGRKRKHHEIETYGNNLSDSQHVQNERIDETHCDDTNGAVQNSSKTQKLYSTDRFTKVIDESMFKFVSCKQKTKFLRKLLIFTSQEKTQCYEYNFYSKRQLFIHCCNQSGKGIKAILDVDENGKECIKIEDKKHQCSPTVYDREKYIELKIVKSPNYEILENCATKSKRMLIIFDSNDRNQCYEYYWSSSRKMFICCGCMQKRSWRVTAEIFHENTEGEYILLSNEEHICKKRKYNPEKYFSCNQFVLSPNFEFQMKIKNGIERKTLIIFDGNDRKLCYTYFCCKIDNIFYCTGCHRKQKTITAKINKNEENEEYVILSNTKHVCSPRNYIRQNEIILRPPKIKFIEATEILKSKLLIFDSTDPNLCYTFSQHGAQNRYRCLGCLAVVVQQKNCINKNKCKTQHIVTAFLGKDDGPNGEYFVAINGGEKHGCKIQKYEPEKYETKILKPKIDYILFYDKERKSDRISLILFYPNDKTRCYKFFYDKYKNIFQCSACSNKNTHISAKLRQDSDGNEYITTNQKKHVCDPLKYSTVIKSVTVILEKSDFDFEKPKKKETDETRIIRLPNFELQKNIFGVPERRLIVFFDEARKFCYDYRYNKCQFICKKCNVSAKVQIDKENDNEKYVVLSEKKHTCEPLKYETEKEIIDYYETENGTSNFMVFNRNDEKKTTKLVIFTSATKELCYEYSYYKRDKTFRCCSCKYLNKIISVKYLSDDGKEYIKLLKNEHVCSPKKFVLEEFQPKIVPQNGFKLCSNKNGKPNSKLILFDSEKDGFVYEYYLKNNNVFICLQCKNKNNITVSAKLFEKENGEKYLELSATKHVCKSKKYEPVK